MRWGVCFLAALTAVPLFAILGKVLLSGYDQLSWSFFTEPTTDLPATALQTVDENKLVLVVLDEESAAVISEKEGKGVFANPEDVIYQYLY